MRMEDNFQCNLNMENYETRMNESRDMSQEEQIQLIQLYREHKELWSCRNPNYLGRKLRKQSWEIVAYEFDLPVGVVMKKMSSLLETHYSEFRKESRNRVTASLTGSDTFKSSKWFFYPYFAFLREKRRWNFKSRPARSIDASQYENMDTDTNKIQNVPDEEKNPLARSLKILESSSNTEDDPFIGFSNYIDFYIKKI